MALNTASGAVLEIGQRTYLLTAQHVIAAALKRAREPRFHFMAGDMEISLRPDSIWSDEQRDLATVAIDLPDPAPVPVVRPPQWPVPALAPGDAILLAGYPSKWKLQTSWDALDFRAFTLLAFVTSVSEHRVTCMLDNAFRVEVESVPGEDLPSLELPGMSGGPAFLITNDPSSLCIPQLCGIVSEGDIIDGGTILWLARVDGVPRAGSV